jgi:uncharacterized protein YegP (UPF0339 family)
MNTPTWVIFKKGLYWRFRLQAPNGKIMLISGNSYTSSAGAKAAIKGIRNTLTTRLGEIVEEQ